jgi:hypothetical protein
MQGCSLWQDKDHPPSQAQCDQCDWCAVFCQDCPERITCRKYDKPKISPASRQMIKLFNLCREFNQLPSGAGTRKERKYLLTSFSELVSIVTQEERKREIRDRQRCQT